VDTIAALFVETEGCYFGLTGIDPWDAGRDARLYAGPNRVVAHPPCERWGRYWHGSPRKPHQYDLGDDGGCFASALTSVRQYGGVLEHPAYSHAWFAHGLPWPPPRGWQRDLEGGWCAQVEQAHYGHMARKATWLYVVSERAPEELIWGPSEQRLPAAALERYGYEKARRIGVMAYVGGKNKKQIRGATPPAFRDLLIRMARAA
jgi:hypothetical protein